MTFTVYPVLIYSNSVPSQIMKGFKHVLQGHRWAKKLQNFSGIFSEKFWDFTFPEKLQPYNPAFYYLNVQKDKACSWNIGGTN